MKQMIGRQRAAAYAIALDSDGKILLTQFEKAGHPRSGAWALPGGGMEWGEQAHETLQREFKEETGLDATVGALLGVQSEWFEVAPLETDKISHALRLIFEVDFIPGALKSNFEDDDTTSDAQWFTMEEVKGLDTVGVVDFGISLMRSKQTTD